ncbi:DUF4245 domain-containing protein [Nocardia sp. BMG51109]|uniref:DUF4245 domain-containing protein n=1 Tax=Nocardia sp. BMG51109 TaxID=1056816 RepID=UPI00046737A3|nr:DUF4245 domain-containing protein [Nocardia sp. BMG51109]
MSYQKPRSQHDYRDLFWSLIPLVLICLAIAAIASQCSFSADGPTPGRIPAFDVHAALRDDARTLPFPIRDPGLPEGWQANSGSRDAVSGSGGGAVSTVGYISPQGTYMRLSQSDAAAGALADHVLNTRSPGGTQEVGGHTWTIYHVGDDEPAWVTDFGSVRVLIKGAGNEGVYRALAGAVGTAQPVSP